MTQVILQEELKWKQGSSVFPLIFDQVHLPFQNMLALSQMLTNFENMPEIYVKKSLKIFCTVCEVW